MVEARERERCECAIASSEIPRKVKCTRQKKTLALAAGLLLYTTHTRTVYDVLFLFRVYLYKTHYYIFALLPPPLRNC